MMELNDFSLNSTPNSWSKQAYVKRFDRESITFKTDFKMFERIETVEYIYEGVVEYYHKNPPGNIPSVLVTSVK